MGNYFFFTKKTSKVLNSGEIICGNLTIKLILGSDHTRFQRGGGMGRGWVFLNYY
jgi:hypothetical protein